VLKDKRYVDVPDDDLEPQDDVDIEIMGEGE